METRVEKYKVYRETIQSKNESHFDEQKSPSQRNTETVSFTTTSSLPLDQVIEAYHIKNQQEVAFYKQRQRRKILQISIISGIALVVIVVLIILLVNALGAK